MTKITSALRNRLAVQVRYEQAVYGSFPFWDRGYAVLASSAGCRPEWLDALRLTAQRYGEPPVGAAEHAGLLAMPFGRGLWMIVGAFPNGCDDRGRPGARGFHALFLTRWMYLRARCNPFVFAGSLHHDWRVFDVDATLSGGSLDVPFWRRDKGSEGASPDPRAGDVASAIRYRRRVVISSSQPIDALARAVWDTLPLAVRWRASVATWALGNDNQFDLVAVPRTGALAADDGELILQE